MLTGLITALPLAAADAAKDKSSNFLVSPDIGLMIWTLIVLLLVFSRYMPTAGQPQQIAYSAFLDDVKNILLLRDIAFECGTIDRGRYRPRARAVEIGHDDLGGARAVKGLAQGLADAVGAAGDNHDLAGHLHRRLLLLLFQVRTRSRTAV